MRSRLRVQATHPLSTSAERPVANVAHRAHAVARAEQSSGFILTIVLGIAGAFLATFVGQAIGWYRHDQGAGFITATIGALVVLFIWNRLDVHRIVPDPSTHPPAPLVAGSAACGRSNGWSLLSAPL